MKTINDDWPGTTLYYGEGLFLRAEDAGLTVRNGLVGRARRIQVAWSEISHFADGEYTTGGTTRWMLVIIPRTGKQVPVRSSTFLPPEVAIAVIIREAAQPHGIPADLTGVPMKKGAPHKRGLYKDPGGQAGLRYWDGTQWSPLLPSAFDNPVTIRKSPGSWSALPMAQGHWAFPATQARRQAAFAAVIALASAAMLTAGLLIVLWWDRALHHKDPSHGGWFWVCCGGLAALFALKAWGRRKFFLRLDEAAKNALASSR